MKVLIDCNDFFLFYLANGHMHMNMIINAPTTKIANKHGAIAMLLVIQVATGHKKGLIKLMCAVIKCKLCNIRIVVTYTNRIFEKM